MSLTSSIKDAVDHLSKDLAQLRTGRASASLIEDVPVTVYGTPQPLKHIAQLSAQDAQTLLIQPFDPSTVKDIEKAFELSDTGMNPSVDGGVLRITLPPMTEERRKELVHMVHARAEEAKVSVRHAREAHMKSIKSDDALSEDDKKARESAAQKEVDAANKKIQELASAKEQEVMSV